MNITPCALEVLLHFYTTPSRHPRDSAPAVQATMHQFQKHGMLEETETRAFDGTYRVTARGEAWIKMLLATPFPEQVWIDPRTKGEQP